MKIVYDLRSQVTVACLHFAVLFLATASRTEDNVPLPRFLPTKTNLTFNRGDTATIACSIVNLGTRSVIWRRASDPTPLTIGVVPYVDADRVSVVHDTETGTWYLSIKHVRPRDSGVYECQVSSKNNLAKLFMLRVNDVPGTSPRPPVFVRGTEVVEVGQPIKLQCNTTMIENSAQDLDWFRTGDKIRQNFNEKVTIKKYEIPGTKIYTSKLEIEHSQKSDTGMYICRNANQEVARIYVDVLNTHSRNVKRGGSTMDESSGGTGGASLPRNISFLHLSLMIASTLILFRDILQEHS